MRVFVTVGTDHHPFTRLLSWVDEWSAAHPKDEVVVQHGASPVRAATPGPHHELMEVEELRTQLARADVAVCSAGPGAVMDARAQGRFPVVVPRLAALGEAVDDHQVAFARHLESHGLARCVESAADLDAALSDARSHRRSSPLSPARSSLRVWSGSGCWLTVWCEHMTSIDSSDQRRSAPTPPQRAMAKRAVPDGGLPDTRLSAWRSGWPIGILTAGMPVMFLLGLHGLVWALPGLVFGFLILRHPEARIPRGAGWLGLFCCWALLSVIQVKGADASSSPSVG